VFRAIAHPPPTLPLLAVHSIATCLCTPLHVPRCGCRDIGRVATAPCHMKWCTWHLRGHAENAVRVILVA